MTDYTVSKMVLPNGDGCILKDASAVKKAGDTMTGDLKVEHSGDTNVIAKCSNTGVSAYLNSHPSGEHGIWSNGYWNGSNFVSNGKYMIYRDFKGILHIADPDVIYEDCNIGTVTTNSLGYLDNRENIPKTITPIATAVQDFGTADGTLGITADGKWIYGTPNTTITNMTVRYYYYRG